MMKNLSTEGSPQAVGIFIKKPDDGIAADNPALANPRTIELSRLDIFDDSLFGTPHEFCGFWDGKEIGHCPGLSNLSNRSSSVSTRFAKSEEDCLS